jgi:hypothetical protein
VPGDSDDGDSDDNDYDESPMLGMGMDRGDDVGTGTSVEMVIVPKPASVVPSLDTPTPQAGGGIEQKPSAKRLQNLAPPPPSPQPKLKNNDDDGGMAALADSRIVAAAARENTPPKPQHEKSIPIVSDFSIAPPPAPAPLKVIKVNSEWEVLEDVEESDGGYGMSYAINTKYPDALIGEGGHSNQVWKAVSLRATASGKKEVIAVKCLRFGLSGESADADLAKREGALAEVSILKLLLPNHHIIGFRGVWNEPLRIRIGLEWAGGGDIRDQVSIPSLQPP